MAKAIESLKAAEQCFGEGLYNSSVSDLNVVQDLRHTADYRENDVSKRQAARALEKARGFVGKIRKGTADG